MVELQAGLMSTGLAWLLKSIEGNLEGACGSLILFVWTGQPKDVDYLQACPGVFLQAAVFACDWDWLHTRVTSLTVLLLECPGRLSISGPGLLHYSAMGRHSECIAANRSDDQQRWGVVAMHNAQWWVMEHGENATADRHQCVCVLLCMAVCSMRPYMTWHVLMLFPQAMKNCCLWDFPCIDCLSNISLKRTDYCQQFL